MNKQKNKLIHVLITDLSLRDVKKDLIYDVTNGRAESAKDLNEIEQNLLLRQLHLIKQDKCGKMQRKVVHLLCLYGMTTSEGKPDYRRIDEYVKNIGYRNRNKKKLLHLSPGEVREVLSQVEVMVNKTLVHHENRR